MDIIFKMASLLQLVKATSAKRKAENQSVVHQLHVNEQMAEKRCLKEMKIDLHFPPLLMYPEKRSLPTTMEA